MNPPRPSLPVDSVLPSLLAALAEAPAAVLAAPPGAGKTTRVPPALATAPWAAGGRILMLEPRRVAARAAAERMAEEAGERTGGRIGYRIRGETRVSAATRIEVMTEGVLTRLLQQDPELPGVAAIVFDEIHERSIHTDLGLALALEVQGALRPDLRLLAMSATLDTARFAALLGGAPVIESAGQLHPVETQWLDAPLLGGARDRRRFEERVAEETAAALDRAPGDALVFLPGVAEIGRVAARLGPLVPGVAVVPLHGSLPFAKQRGALAADPDGRRRVVLATAIAETSLTVEGVRIVVDAGKARRAAVSPATGLPRLVTQAVSRAEADQRRGRAGRLGPGACFRLWTRGEEGALPAEAPAEILTADLAPLALDLAVWGVEDPGDLAFADPPPAPAMAEARGLLTRLGALDPAGRATAHGRAMARFPAHPRLAHMLIAAGEEGHGTLATRLAALIEARDPLPGQRADLAAALRALDNPAAAAREGADRGALERIGQEAARLARGLGASPSGPVAAGEAGGLLSLAFPDRVALRRPGEAPRYLLANGRGAALAPGDGLAGQRLLVALDVDDRGSDARIRRAVALDEASLRARHAVETAREARWSRRERRVIAEERVMLGAIALEARRWRDVPAADLGAALVAGLRDLGPDLFETLLDWPKTTLALRARIGWLRAQEGPLAARLADPSATGLLATLEDWLMPFLAGETTPGAIPGATLATALDTLIGHELLREIERAAPAHYVTPLGTKAAIDYTEAVPLLRVRVQEMFGETRHPSAGSPPMPLLLELTSPAGRPVQRTRDLPGFWASSYADVAKDMRAQYPKHPWPEDPATAAPTRRAKPRR
ncbi:MAG: ATP-dependent helicase HrpB [Pseudomonadota bacterium]